MVFPDGNQHQLAIVQASQAVSAGGCQCYVVAVSGKPQPSFLPAFHYRWVNAVRFAVKITARNGDDSLDKSFPAPPLFGSL